MKHKAVITAIGHHTLTLKFDVGVTGCSSCRLASVCCTGNKSDAATPPSKFTVKVDDISVYKVGEIVTVESVGSSVAYAFIIGFVVPVALLLIFVIGSSVIWPDNVDSSLGGAAGIVAVALWFLLLKLCGKRVERKVLWRVVQ